MGRKEVWRVSQATITDPEPPPHPPVRTRPGVDGVVTVLVLFLAVFSLLGGIDTQILRVAPEAPTRADAILEDTLTHLSEKSWDEVASLQGQKDKSANLADHDRYRVDLAVSPASVGLLEIEAVLFDRESGQEVDRLVTFRSRRAGTPR